MKRYIYKRKVIFYHDLRRLKTKNTSRICVSINPEVLFRVKQNYVERINKCFNINDEQFEYLMK